VVLFGEYLPVHALARASELATRAGLMLCIGSSLEVYPVADLPLRTLAAGGQVAIITKGPTALDERAAVRLDGDVVTELEAVAAALELKRSPRPEPEKRPRSATA
jgi:NAD-dependent deacetylase